MADIEARIKNYLCSGGLFNPEMMEHDKVRNLIMDCRAEIERLRMELRHIANTFDESWVKGSVERMMGDRARKALNE